MASWLMWVILISVALLLWAVGTFYSLRPLRWVSLITAAAAVIAIIRYGYGLTHPAPANLVNAFNNGVDGVIKALLHVLWLGRSAPSPGPVGRGVLAFLVLLGYRGLEAWTMRRQAPRLDTSVVGDGQASIKPDSGPGSRSLTDGQRHDQLADELKFRLSAMKMRSPAILPGGSKPNELASIAEASGNSTAGLAGAVIAFVGAIWPNPRRFQLKVRMESQHADKAEGAPRAPAGTRVTVDLDDARSGATISSKTVAACNDEEAASMVAGYVARQMFAKDRATPRWCYGAIDGSDLGAWLLCQLERVPPGSKERVKRSRTRQIQCMWQAADSGQAAGVVRYELAQLLDLAGDVDELGQHELRLHALRLHAMNREQYPRFCRGRYRFAMSLQMVSNPKHPAFDVKDTKVTLDDILEILRRCGVPKEELAGKGLAPPDASGRCELSPSLRCELLKIAARELRMLRRQLSLWWVVWDTVRRRDERSTWRPHWRLRHRQEFRDGVRVAELLVAVRLKLMQEKAGKAKPLSRREVAHLWLGMRITSAITGDRESIRWLLSRPHGCKHPRSAAGSPAPETTVGEDKVRWLPWQRRTASWMAEYNTACLYAALVNIVPKAVDKVVASLERATSNPDSEMERAYDWISQDPDFTAVRSKRRFVEFLEAQDRRDYPAAFTAPVSRKSHHAKVLAVMSNGHGGT